MVAILFVAVFGVLVVGFLVWAVAFGGMKRRAQSGTEQTQKRTETEGRAPGLN